MDSIWFGVGAVAGALGGIQELADCGLQRASAGRIVLGNLAAYLSACQLGIGVRKNKLRDHASVRYRVLMSGGPDSEGPRRSRPPHGGAGPASPPTAPGSTVGLTK